MLKHFLKWEHVLSMNTIGDPASKHHPKLLLNKTTDAIPPIKVSNLLHPNAKTDIQMISHPQMIKIDRVLEGINIIVEKT